MILIRRSLVVMLLAGLLATLVLAGCTESSGERVSNIPPETTLSFSPDEGATANYRVRMNWFGWDPDGEISYYWTKWDTLDWLRVVSTDSVFLVSAFKDSIDEQRAYEYHSFSVKAVDNEGAEDPTPENISFTAFTIVPDTEIVRGPAGTTGPMVTFEWNGTDRDGVIVGYSYELYRLDPSTGQWLMVTSAYDLDAEDTSVIFGPIDGRHRFYVWSIDDAGAEDQTPVMREFNCDSTIAGPILYIRTNVFGTIKYQGKVWSDEYNVPTPIFAGERLAFSWVGDASNYGGDIVGYRHAYDDTSTWPAWSIFDTRFEVTPTPGRHSLYVSAIDNANEITRARIFFEVVEASLDDYILIVDDWDNQENIPSPKFPDDAQRSAFYDSLLAGYARDRVEWEPSQHMDSGQEMPPDVDAMRGASTVVWYVDDAGNTISRMFLPSNQNYNALSGYVRIGGNLILCGKEVLRQILVDAYPINDITAADTTQAGIFVRDFLRVGWADYSGSEANQENDYKYGYCFYGAIPDVGVDDIFEPMYIDSLGKWRLWYGADGRGLPAVEIMDPYMGTSISSFRMDAFLNYNFDDQTCAVIYVSGTNHGNIAYFGFPFYSLKTPDVQHNMDAMLQIFGEEKIVK